jgi:hypothetical protein
MNSDLLENECIWNYLKLCFAYKIPYAQKLGATGGDLRDLKGEIRIIYQHFIEKTKLGVATIVIFVGRISNHVN